MANTNNTVSMTDNVSPALRNMNKAIQNSINLMEKLNKVSNSMTMENAMSKSRLPKNPPLLLASPKESGTPALIKNQELKLSPEIIDVEWAIEPLSNRPELEANRKIIDVEWAEVPKALEPPKVPEESGASGGNKSSSTEPSLPFLSMKSLMDISKKVVSMGIEAGNYLDTISEAKNRIDSINDGTQTTSELQSKILSAANNSRMSYEAMQDSVIGLNSSTNGAFKSNDEAIVFADTLGKMFAISGASAEGAQGTMAQLTEAMADGNLQGDQLNSILKNAPMLADAIATEIGRPKEELQSLASEGSITSEILKSAMFNASDEVNGKLQDVPMTFGQRMQAMSNNISVNITKLLEPIATKFSEWLNSESAEKFFNAIAIGIGIVGTILGGIVSIVEGVIEVLGKLKPILVVIGILILTYLLTPFIVTAMAFLSVLPLMAAELLKNALKMAAQWFIAYWPIILIVGGILLLIYILMQLGVTFDQIVGFIVGLVYSLAAIIYNIVIDIINPFIIFATFLSNLFIDPVGAIKMLFLDMASFIIDKVAWVAGALEDLINLIPGVEIDMTSGLDDMSSMIKAAKEKVEEESGVEEAKTLEHKDVGAEALKGFDKGSDFIKGLQSGSKEGGMFGDLKDKFNLKDSDKFGGLTDSGILESGNSAFSNPSDIGNVGSVGEVGKINEDVSITEEDIKLLRDIAEAKFVNSYTTLRPEMKVEFTGPINETADVHKILSAIEDMAAEAMANTIIEEAI